MARRPDCLVCQDEAPANASIPEPPPLMASKRGAPSSVDTSRQCCPLGKCRYYGWLGRGNIIANGHPGGGCGVNATAKPAEHFDKSRKTAFAVTLGMFEKFDLKVEKGTRMLFVMRDIYYESWENIHKKARQVFKPAAWFTMLAEGEFDAKGNFNWVNQPELIPPRLAKYAKAMGAISDDLKAVIKGFEKLFPSFIKKRP